MRLFIALVLACVVSFETMAAQWRPVWLQHIPAKFQPNSSFRLARLGIDRDGNVFVTGGVGSTTICVDSNVCFTGPTNFVLCYGLSGQMLAATGVGKHPAAIASLGDRICVLQADC